LSSCSRRLLFAAAGLLLAILALPGTVRALSVQAVYRSACARELGVILRVEKREIHLLRLDGTLVAIPRHEIVSLLYYPLSQLPLARIPIPPELPPLRVTTRFAGEVVELVNGWPIDYSENQISFLLRSGKELVIERESIWSLSYDTGGDPPAPAAAAPGRPADPIVFVHPQTSGFCTEGEPPEGARKIFAQQILNDQIVIRRELDRLREGLEQVVEYEQDQKFFPVPFVYRDRTMLGLWVSLLSRYGASSTRSNNFTPLLVDELSLGPFRYQHLFLSGAAPNDMFLHHEAQSQIFYRFKAAYFHASVFFDPDLLLVGTRYSWREADLEDETYDDRLNEILGIEFGFDWGPFSLELFPAVLGQSAVKIGDDLFDATSEHNLWRAGVRVSAHSWRAQIALGYAKLDTFSFRDIEVDGELQFIELDATWRYGYGRLNLGWRPTSELDLSLSLLARQLDYDVRIGPQREPLEYDSLSLSSAVQGTYALSHRLSVGGHLIAELHRREATGFAAAARILPRVGLFTGFWF
jgi:hypothetical protein